MDITGKNDIYLDAVVITLIPENEDDEEWERFTKFFARCVAMEPTPPAPPMIRIDGRYLLLSLLSSVPFEVIYILSLYQFLTSSFIYDFYKI
jgi:hypothetical protein